MLAALAVCSLWGCADFGSPQEAREQRYGDVDMQGAYPTLRRVSFETIDLVELVDPRGAAAAQYKEQWDAASRGRNYGARYAMVFSWFRTTADMTTEQKRVARNGIQERLMAASILRCTAFKSYIQRRQSDFNFALGAATTVSAVVGAIMPGVRDARNLAGAAGIFSGVQAEMNQDYFSNLAAHVIGEAIDAKQASVSASIRTQGQPKDIVSYPLEAALYDAIYFDGLCSIGTGLRQADTAIQALQNPGLNAATKAIVAAKAMNKILASDISALNASGDLITLQQIVDTNTGLAASTQANPAFSENLANFYVTLSDSMASTVTSEATVLSVDYANKYSQLNPTKAGGGEGDAKVILQVFGNAWQTKIVEPLASSTCSAKITAVSTDLSKAQVAYASSSDKVSTKADVDAAAVKVKDMITRLTTYKTLALSDLHQGMVALDAQIAATAKPEDLATLAATLKAAPTINLSTATSSQMASMCK